MPPKSSSTKQAKDPNAPKKSMSSYVLFANDMRPKLKTSHPELSFGEIAKALGAEWKKVKPDVKQHYEKLAEKGKAKYESDFAYYQKKMAVLQQVVMHPVQYHRKRRRKVHHRNQLQRQQMEKWRLQQTEKVKTMNHHLPFMKVVRKKMIQVRLLGPVKKMKRKIE